MKRRMLSLLLAAALILSLFSGCSLIRKMAPEKDGSDPAPANAEEILRRIAQDVDSVQKLLILADHKFYPLSAGRSIFDTAQPSDSSEQNYTVGRRACQGLRNRVFRIII